MIVCTPITPEGLVGHSWGRARTVAILNVDEGRIIAEEVEDVSWNSLHDEGTEGSHHARVARFLKSHHVDVVLASHMGAPMSNMIDKLGIRLILGATGDARQAALAAGATA